MSDITTNRDCENSDSVTVAEYVKMLEAAEKPENAGSRRKPLNVIDLTLKNNGFRHPSFLDKISFAARYRSQLPAEWQSAGAEYYTLLSQNHCVTQFHEDFSGTGVFYALLKGAKEFVVVKPTNNNLEIFRKQYDELPGRSGLFFANHKDLDGPAIRFRIFEQEALLLPPLYIHLVKSYGTCVSQGANVIMNHRITEACETYMREVALGVESRFPNFLELVVIHVASTMQRCSVMRGNKIGLGAELLTKRELHDLDDLWTAALHERNELLKVILNMKNYLSISR